VRGADYIVKRMLFAVGTVLVAITLNFVLFRALPGDAVSNLSRVPHATPQLREALTKEFGLDKPKWEQYLIYLQQLLHFNLGRSFVNQQPVWTNLKQKLANTIPMVALGTFFAIVLGIGTGVLSSWRRGSVGDHISTNVAIAFYAVPTQWLGLMLLIVFSSWLPWVPTNGMTNPFLIDPTFLQHLGDVLAHMFLPSLTLALTLYGEYTLIVRSAMLETLGEDYVLTARAKGLPQRTIVRRHALRNAMLPIATLIALSLGYIVAGTILIEVVFSWPGIGRAIYDAVVNRDYPMLQGAFLILTLSVVFFNFLADLLYFRLDPRISE
jgi:ABC-type dipeptide/oligopeptide/nickel transport system permease component